MAIVGEWYKKVGDSIAVDDVIVDHETDKVDVEVGAEVAGVLVEITHTRGDSVKIGDVLAIIEPVES